MPVLTGKAEGAKEMSTNEPNLTLLWTLLLETSRFIKFPEIFRVFL